MAGNTLAAPRTDTTISADSELYTADVTALAGDLDLTAVAGKPNHAPQLTLLINNTAASITVLVTAEKNTNIRSVRIPANSTITVPVPIALVTKAGSGAAAVWCFWRAGSGVQFNRGTPA